MSVSLSRNPLVPILRARLRVARRGSDASSLSHLHQIEALRKALDLSKWPVAKTQGKRPQVKASFGPAISVGYESEAEYCDVELNGRLDFKTCTESFNKNLPEGYSLMQVRSIPRFFPSLEKTINVAEFEIHSAVLEGTEEVWKQFMSKEQFPVIKKKEDKSVVIDARPLVRDLKVSGGRMDLVLRFFPGRTLKPERIIQSVLSLTDEQTAMGTPACALKVKRVQFYFEKQTGELSEPI